MSFFTTLKHFVVRRFRLLALALLIVGAIGYFSFGNGDSLGATFTVASGDFTKVVNVSGTVKPSQNVDLGFAATGRISGTYARVGQYVGAGTLLAQVENGDLVAEVQQKEAKLAALLAGTRPEQLAIDAAAVASDRTKVINAITDAYTLSDDAVHNKTDTFFSNPRIDPKLSFSVSNASLKNKLESDRAIIEPVFTSWSTLLSTMTPENATGAAKEATIYLNQVIALLADANSALNQAVTDQTNTSTVLASYATTLATARTNVNDATTALAAASASLSESEKTLALDQAGSTASDIAAARADLKNAQAALEKTRVYAPFSGTVTRMDAKMGQIVSPSASEISMQSNGLFEIETFIPEVAIADVVAGNPATTTLDAYGSALTFPAKVIAVDPAETVKDGIPTYKTTLVFLVPDARIRSGMTANVIIATGTLHNAIVIPSGAVGTSLGERFVSVLEGEKTVRRLVETGTSPSLGQIEVVSGLSPGDIILLSPES